MDIHDYSQSAPLPLLEPIEPNEISSIDAQILSLEIKSSRAIRESIIYTRSATVTLLDYDNQITELRARRKELTDAQS